MITEMVMNPVKLLPYLRAMYETDMPDLLPSRSALSFSDSECRRRRWASVTTEIISTSLQGHSHKPSRMKRRSRKALYSI